MARRSRRKQVKKRQTKRVQRGGDGGFFSWAGIKSLFTRKAAAPTSVDQNFSVVNPMQVAAPTVNAEGAIRRKAVLNNMTQRRRLGQSHLVNLQSNIRDNQEVNVELARINGSEEPPLGGRSVFVPENLQRRRNARNASKTAYDAGVSARNYGNSYANVQMTDAELKEELARLRQGGGGLTAAQIDAAASNI